MGSKDNLKAFIRRALLLLLALPVCLFSSLNAGCGGETATEDRVTINPFSFSGARTGTVVYNGTTNETATGTISANGTISVPAIVLNDPDVITGVVDSTGNVASATVTLTGEAQPFPRKSGSGTVTKDATGTTLTLNFFNPGGISPDLRYVVRLNAPVQ